MKEMWEQRYGAEGYAYGTEPNVFFKSTLEKYAPSGHFLFPAEGEGRNAVYAAGQGLRVTACDLSEQGRSKALKLAEQRSVSLRYELGDFAHITFEEAPFDGAVLIFAHFPEGLRSSFHRKISDLVHPGGLVILEGFSQSNLPLREANPRVGGPNKLEMLFTPEAIRSEFPDFEALELAEVETELSEGEFHVGLARVVRFVGRKTSG